MKRTPVFASPPRRFSFTKSLLSLILLLLAFGRPVGAYGDPPQTFTTRTPSGSEFVLEVIPVEGTLSREAYASIQTGVFLIHRILSERLGVEFPSRLDFKIRLFAAYKDYKDYQQKTGAGEYDWGYYSGRDNEIVIPFYPTEAETLRVLLHETVHGLLRQSIVDLPRWINEGLAEYFEGAQLQDAIPAVSADAGRDQYLQELLQKGEWMELRAYLEIGGEWEEFNKATLSPPYAVAGSLVYFLMSKLEGQEVLRQFLKYLKDHPGREQSSTETINLYYPGGIEQLERDWKNWLQADSSRDRHEYPALE